VNAARTEGIAYNVRHCCLRLLPYVKKSPMQAQDAPALFINNIGVFLLLAFPVSVVSGYVSFDATDSTFCFGRVYSDY
jgi:hypothetical protein